MTLRHLQQQQILFLVLRHVQLQRRVVAHGAFPVRRDEKLGQEGPGTFGQRLLDVTGGSNKSLVMDSSRDHGKGNFTV